MSCHSQYFVLQEIFVNILISCNWLIAFMSIVIFFLRKIFKKQKNIFHLNIFIFPNKYFSINMKIFSGYFLRLDRLKWNSCINKFIYFFQKRLRLFGDGEAMMSFSFSAILRYFFTFLLPPKFPHRKFLPVKKNAPTENFSLEKTFVKLIELKKILR